MSPPTTGADEDIRPFLSDEGLINALHLFTDGKCLGIIERSWLYIDNVAYILDDPVPGDILSLDKQLINRYVNSFAQIILMLHEGAHL